MAMAAGERGAGPHPRAHAFLQEERRLEEASPSGGPLQGQGLLRSGCQGA